MTDRARDRLNTLSRHLECDTSSKSSVGSHQNQQIPSLGAASNPTSAPTCYNFEPGQLLLNQVALVTGAGSGIGRATALLFAHHGAYVTISDKDPKAAQATYDFIINSSISPDRCIVVTGDVTEPGFSERLISETIKAFGNLHILIPNAGFTWDAVVHKMTDKQWDAMLNVHLTAVFRLVRAAAPYMRDAAKKEKNPNPRSIITISSISGTHGNAGQTNYAAGKAGIVGFTKALAKEWGSFNIRCNTVAYGHINTRLVQAKEKGVSIEYQGEQVKLGIPQSDVVAQGMRMQTALQRLGQPEEAAGALLLLASPYASYITGQVIEVNGGMYM